MNRKKVSCLTNEDEPKALQMAEAMKSNSNNNKQKG